MKKVILFLAVLVVFVAPSFGQTAPDAPELTKMLNEFLAGAGRNDAAVHDRFWADDLIYTRSAGVRTNKEEIMKGLRTPATPRKETDPVTVYTAEDIRIQQYGNTAVVAFKLVSTTTKSDGTKTVGNNLNTGTFIKRDGQWRVVAWQSTIVPEPKPAAAQETKAETAKPATTTTRTGTRVYQKGSRGGCYYVSSSGSKVYVDHKFCS